MRRALNRLTCSVVQNVHRSHIQCMCLNSDYKIKISWQVAEDNLLKLDGFQQCPEYNVKQYRVAAASAAASIQSIVYGGTVASSSTFAALQSAGAAGLSAKATAGLFTAGVAAATWLKSWFAPCDEGPECSSKKE